MLRDTTLIFRSEMTLALREPIWLGFGLAQPIVYLALFGPLMVKIVATTPGFPPGTAMAVLTPALVIQLALTSGAFSGYHLISDLDAGVIERLRVTPSSRVALLLGRVSTSVVQTFGQGIVLVVLAKVLFGVNASFVGVLITLIFAGLLTLTVASCSHALALRVKTQTAFTALTSPILVPLMLLSGVLIPITTGLAPRWLFILSKFNPLTYVVDAGRATFRGDFGSNAVWLGCLVLLAITAASVWWGGRTFQRENL
jgi:ABC-2 type transport system permease protein